MRGDKTASKDQVRDYPWLRMYAAEFRRIRPSYGSIAESLAAFEIGVFGLNEWRLKDGSGVSSNWKKARAEKNSVVAHFVIV